MLVTRTNGIIARNIRLFLSLQQLKPPPISAAFDNLAGSNLVETFNMWGYGDSPLERVASCVGGDCWMMTKSYQSIAREYFLPFSVVITLPRKLYFMSTKFSLWSCSPSSLFSQFSSEQTMTMMKRRSPLVGTVECT